MNSVSAGSHLVPCGTVHQHHWMAPLLTLTCFLHLSLQTWGICIEHPKAATDTIHWSYDLQHKVLERAILQQAVIRLAEHVQHEQLLAVCVRCVKEKLLYPQHQGIHDGYEGPFLVRAEKHQQRLTVADVIFRCNHSTQSYHLLSINNHQALRRCCYGGRAFSLDRISHRICCVCFGGETVCNTVSLAVICTRRDIHWYKMSYESFWKTCMTVIRIGCFHFCCRRLCIF